MTGLENTTLTEGKTITVTCLINRLFNPMSASNFIMTWSSNSKSSTSFPNGDGSNSYVIRMTKKLLSSDNGRIVDCTLTSMAGERFSESQTIVCMYIFNLKGPGISYREGGGLQNGKI